MTQSSDERLQVVQPSNTAWKHQESLSCDTSERCIVESNIASRRALSHAAVHFSSAACAGSLQLQNSNYAALDARAWRFAKILSPPFSKLRAGHSVGRLQAAPLGGAIWSGLSQGLETLPSR